MGKVKVSDVTNRDVINFTKGSLKKMKVTQEVFERILYNAPYVTAVKNYIVTGDKKFLNKIHNHICSSLPKNQRCAKHRK